MKPEFFNCDSSIFSRVQYLQWSRGIGKQTLTRWFTWGVHSSPGSCWVIYIYKYNMNSQGVNAKCSAGQWYCSKTCSRWYGESPVFVFICINWCWISVIEGEVIWSRKSPSQITKGRFKPMSNDEYAVEFVFRPKFPKNNHTGNWCFLAQTCSVPPVHKSCWIYLILVAPNPHMQWPSWPAHVATHSSLAESPWTLI